MTTLKKILIKKRLGNLTNAEVEHNAIEGVKEWLQQKPSHTTIEIVIDSKYGELFGLVKWVNVIELLEELKKEK